MRKIKARPPMLVMREIHNTELETKEFTAAISFKLGAAQKYHYDLMLDLANLLRIAGNSAPKRKYAADFVDKKVFPALASIKQRYDKTGKLGVSSSEDKILCQLVEVSKQFWIRQPIELYQTCVDELKAYYAEQRRRQKNETQTL